MPVGAVTGCGGEAGGGLGQRAVREGGRPGASEPAVQLCRGQGIKHAQWGLGRPAMRRSGGQVHEEDAVHTILHTTGTAGVVLPFGQTHT